MIILGVDPGLDGAFASWDGNSLVLYAMSAIKAGNKGRELNLSAMNDAIDLLFPLISHSFVEKISSRTNQSTVATFKQGTTYGQQLGALSARRFPTTKVPPKTWKIAMQVTADKESSMARACELFPGQATKFYGPKGGKKDGLAEAALIAYYGYQKLLKGGK